MYVHVDVSVFIFWTWIAGSQGLDIYLDVSKIYMAGKVDEAEDYSSGTPAESVPIALPIAIATTPFFYTKDKLNFSEAESYCRSQDGRLVTLQSRSKYEAFLADDKDFYDDYSLQNPVHIGLSTSSTNCTNYIWSSGQPLSWSNWNSSNFDPSQCSEYQCIQMHRRMFRPDSCFSERKAVCEYVDQVSEEGPDEASTLSSTSDRATQSTPNLSVTTMKVKTNETMTTEVLTNTAMSVTTVSSTGPTTVNSSCDCCTRRQTNVTQFSQTELLEVITQLKAELSVSKNNTSTHRRKLISVYESKPSSMVMGGVACTIMSVVIGWIVVPDFIMLCFFLFKCASKNVVMPSV